MLKRTNNLKFTILMTAIACLSIFLAACTSDETGNQDGDATSSEGKISIEVMESGWDNTPTDENDPYKKWLDETFDVDFKLSPVPIPDLESSLLTRFASQDPPDLIYSHDLTFIEKLYNQGVLYDELDGVMDQLPSIAAMLDDNAYNLTTKDGKMYAIPKPPNPATFSLMIRKDWLDNLNLDIPETADELLEVIRQFTFNDPDQNGEDDTWGISSAGGGSGIGEITWLLGMYGQYQGFFVEDNEVHTSLTNGTHKNFLDFMRILVDEKLIDPDWYTQSWEQRKPKQFTDKIGMLWYPGVIVAEHEELIGNTGERVDVWESIPVPKANENGGLNPAEGLTSGGYAISKQAGEDKEKLAKILEILEGVTYPNDGYWAMRWGVGSDGQEFMELDNDFKFYTEINDNYRKEFPGAWDYGHWVDNKRDKVLQSSESEPGAVALKQIELDTKSANFPKPTNYSDLLRLDVQKLSEVSRIVEEFEIKYILGDEDDYDSFVQNWMNQGGEELMKSAEEQFREMGIIN